MCDYRCEKKITLNKLKNTKHTDVTSSKIESENKSLTPKHKFQCDQCNFSCQAKSSLKKQVSQSHEGSNKKPCMQCDKCDKTFQKETELEIHMTEQHCPPEENQENLCNWHPRQCL